MRNQILKGCAVRHVAHWVFTAAVVAALPACDSDTKSVKAERDNRRSSTESASASIPDGIDTLTCSNAATAMMIREPILVEADIETADSSCLLENAIGSLELQISNATSLELALAGALESKSATPVPQMGIGSEAAYAEAGAVSAVAWKQQATDTRYWVVISRPSGEGDTRTEGQLVDLAGAIAETL